MEPNKILDEILLCQKQKYNLLNRMLDTTREMERVFKEDEMAFGMLLDMRKSIMDSVDKINIQTAELADKLPDKEREAVQEHMVTSSIEVPMGRIGDIYRSNKQNMELLERIISVNNAINNQISKVMSD
ncbi:MAG: hypothetical protein FWH14_00105 [Oscillospiraceae bacterium]|nr:hypothetical protein [Oscillospiraceae bacterium]